MIKWIKYIIISWAFNGIMNNSNEKMHVLRSNILRFCNDDELMILKDWLNSYKL